VTLELCLYLLAECHFQARCCVGSVRVRRLIYRHILSTKTSLSNMGRGWYMKSCHKR
jgi:hypothetical protein